MFYRGDSALANMDLLARYMRLRRPLSLCADRAFHFTGSPPTGTRKASRLDEGGPTALIRSAIEAPGNGMIRARFPEAKKGGVEEALRDAPGSATHDVEAQGHRTQGGQLFRVGQVRPLFGG
jgi:hypothetical protein